jgi:integral membrane protein (TIGR01906 family)
MGAACDGYTIDRTPVPEMARIITFLLGIAIALAVPVVLTVNGLRLVTNDHYVRAVYEHGGVPEDRYGLSADERTRLAVAGLASIQPSSAAGIDVLRAARLRNGEAAFNSRELAHMEDVRTLVARAYRLQVILVVAIGILAVILGLLSSMRSLVPVALARGAVLTVILAVAVAIVAATSYSSFETPFHTVFFDGESWRFAETDTLRRLYPDRFWLDTAVVIGGLAVLQALVLFPLARLWAGRADARQALRMRARTEST